MIDCSLACARACVLAVGVVDVVAAAAAAAVAVVAAVVVVVASSSSCQAGQVGRQTSGQRPSL